MGFNYKKLFGYLFLATGISMFSLPDPVFIVVGFIFIIVGAFLLAGE